MVTKSKNGMSAGACTTGGCGCRCHFCILGLSMGIVWGGLVLIVGLLTAITGWTFPLANLLGMAYLGAKSGLMAVLMGGIWAFIDGFILGALLGVAYRFFEKCGCCYCHYCSSKAKKK